jgi:hypothetical protein
MIYDDEYINYLLKCEKYITDPPNKEYKEVKVHMKKTIKII